jgi:signal transduction histidine kinase
MPRFRVVAEVLLAAVLVALLAFTAYALSISWGGRSWLLDVVSGAIAGSAALLRRRFPAGAAVTVFATALAAIVLARTAGLPREPGPATALAVAVVVGSAVRLGSARFGGGVALGGLVVTGAALATGGTSTVPVVALIAWLGAVAYGLGLRLLDTRRRAAAEHVRRDERLDLARELHDVVAHHVTGIVVQAQAAQIVARRDPGRVDDSLAGIEAAGSDALVAMRRVVGILRDTGDAAPSSPGPEELEDLIQRFGNAGRAVHLSLPDERERATWPPEITSTVYRVVRESLTNVARHAPHAGTVTVGVARTPDAVTVHVLDDGPPAAHRYRPGGYGLEGMRERLDALGGTLRAGPLDQGGWAVRAALPLDRRH